MDLIPSESPPALISLSYIVSPDLYAMTAGQENCPLKWRLLEHSPVPEDEMVLFARNALDALGAGALLPYSPAIMASLLVSKIVLFSAITSNEPYIHSPFHPPIGPMSLFVISA